MQDAEDLEPIYDHLGNAMSQKNNTLKFTN